MVGSFMGKKTMRIMKVHVSTKISTKKDQTVSLLDTFPLRHNDFIDAPLYGI